MSNDFHQLMRDVQAGSDEAAEQLLAMCNQQIQRAIRRRLGRKLRQQFDSQDFTQAVWKSFFANLSTVTAFDGPRPLIAFLTQVACNKVADEWRRRNQKRRPKNGWPASLIGEEDVASLDPTASEVAIANERLEEMAGDQSRLRRIVDMRVAGSVTQEIAEELNISTSTVRRVMRKLRKRELNRSSIRFPSEAISPADNDDKPRDSDAP